eukprot:SAG22_NODE_1457_length_4381_cov_6.147828_6_plen_44_part_00
MPVDFAARRCSVLATQLQSTKEFVQSEFSKFGPVIDVHMPSDR